MKKLKAILGLVGIVIFGITVLGITSLLVYDIMMELGIWWILR